MKKTFIAFFIALLFSLTGYAREVSEQYAREYVVDYISLHTTDNYTVKSIFKAKLYQSARPSTAARAMSMPAPLKR